MQKEGNEVLMAPAAVLTVCLNTLGIPKTLSGDHEVKRSFSNIKMSFVFFILFRTLRTFQELQDV